MLVKIVKRTFSGAEYCPEQKVLKLGGEGNTGVETLEFELPEEWAGMAVTVHVQQLDGTLPQPVLLGEDRCLEVDRMFTASEKGLWMLRAMDGNGYCAMTRPARYECYETFATDGDTEITPSQYEAFVAQVLGAANTASQKAKDAQSAADRAEGAAGEAQKAKAAAADSAQQAKGEAESAQTAAQQADKAAARAEGYAPKDGTVLSVNSKGGAVQLDAQDVAAVPLPVQPLPGEVVRILSVDTATGAVQTDTTPLPDLRPYVRSETVPTAATPGAVRADGQYGVAVRADATLTTVPATAAQLDRMTEAYAPLTPALLPYGVKKALTSAAGAASWSAQEKAAVLLQLGADDRFYSKAEADRKFSTGYTLPCATAAVLGGVKPGRGLTVSADGTLEVTAENLDTVLGFSLTEKLKRLERMMDMDGKLVYTGAGTAGKAATSLTVPETVDYIVVRMVAPTAENSTNQVAAAAEYGSTRIVRGGTAVAMVGGVSYDFSNGVKCSGAAPVRMSFADSGVLSIGVVRTDSSLSFEYPFNVEGYQYV